MSIISAWYADSLICPDCQSGLVWKEGLSCTSCGYARSLVAPVDLRPQSPRLAQLSLPRITAFRETLDKLDLSRPTRSYIGPKAERDSSELFSAAMPYLPAGSRLLDLGCGPRDQAVVASHCQYQYVGVDYTNPAADLLADAHALPFRQGTFDGILSYAVLEHLSSPFVAIQEIRRILRPGGVFFGTVSQGEPFHDSFFHHTAHGVLSLFETAGLRAKRLWYSYDTLKALAVMGRYSRPLRLALRLVDGLNTMLPFLTPRKYFRWTPRQRELDAIYRAASICFVAVAG